MQDYIGLHFIQCVKIDKSLEDSILLLEAGCTKIMQE